MVVNLGSNSDPFPSEAHRDDHNQSNDHHLQSSSHYDCNPKQVSVSVDLKMLDREREREREGLSRGKAIVRASLILAEQEGTLTSYEAASFQNPIIPMTGECEPTHAT
jgi:hypothetical protein